jgi:hypothetical protein
MQGMQMMCAHLHAQWVVLSQSCAEAERPGGDRLRVLVGHPCVLRLLFFVFVHG